MTNTAFVAWLQNELDEQGWSRADLARATGFHKGSISNVLNGQRQPSVEFVLAVARALKVKPEDLYRRAGLLPPVPSPAQDPLLDEALEILKRLPPDEQQNVIEYAKFRYQRSLNP